MSGLCGWVDLRPDRRDGHTIASDMLAGLPGSGEPGARHAAWPGGGLAIRPSMSTGWLATDGDVAAAIEGYPRWSDDELAQIALSQDNAKALLAAFARYGVHCLDRLHGPFSLAIVAPSRGEALVAVDRFAIHPMGCCRLDGGGLVFGSSFDAIRRHPDVALRTSPQAVFNYLFFYSSPSPGSIYAGGSKLLPGQYLHLDGGGAVIASYWHVPYSQIASVDRSDAEQRLLSGTRDAVLRCVGGEPLSKVGTYLSGGLDSSTVTGMLARAGTGAAKAFTIGFDAPGFDETEFARAAAKHFGVEHHVYYVTPRDVVDAVPKLAEIYDEPFGNSSAVPALYCARLARDNSVDLLLAGDGGDEIFAGNERYSKELAFERGLGRMRGVLRRLVPLLVRLAPAGRSNVIRRAIDRLRRAGTPLPDRLYAYGYLFDMAVDAIFESDVARLIDRHAPIAIAREAFDRPSAASPLQRMMHLDLQLTLADNDLRKVTRTAECAGVRVRYPMLDEDLVRFAAGLPDDLLMAGGRLRDLYRQAMRTFLPATTIEKKKHGFGPPTLRWLMEEDGPRSMCRDMLRRLRSRGMLRRDFLDLVDRMLVPEGDDRLVSVAWDLMMFEFWMVVRSDATGVESRRGGELARTASG